MHRSKAEKHGVLIGNLDRTVRTCIPTPVDPERHGSEMVWVATYDANLHQFSVYTLMAPILPPELWSIIVDNLSRSDQLYISEVSSQLCAVARRAIYRKVYLQYDGGDSEQATIELLLRDQSVARLVKHLHLEDFVGAPREPAWFDADALSGMTRLQQLSLLGMPFRTEDDQVKFNKIASESLPALRILEYRALVFTKQWESSKRKREEHLPVLQIVGLQQITWIDPGT